MSGRSVPRETPTSALSLAGGSEGEQFTTSTSNEAVVPSTSMSAKRRGKQRADENDVIENSAATQEPSGKLIPAKSWVHFVAGGLGGMSGAIVTAPFDVVKTRLQSDLFATSAKTPISPSSTGVLNTTRRLLYHFVETGVLLR